MDALTLPLEIVAASVYFAPEVHREYERLGYPMSDEPDPLFANLKTWESSSYFWSRGAGLGDVSGEAIASAAYVFKPAAVIEQVASAKRVATRDEILTARLNGQVAYLEGALSDQTKATAARATELMLRAADAAPLGGRPTFAGLRALGLAGTPLGDLWRVADQLREFRGDNHFNVLAVNAIKPTVSLRLMESAFGLEPRRYAATRFWSNAEFDAADAEMVERGWLAEGAPEKLTPAGTDARTELEAATDALQQPVNDALGDDYDELVALLTAMAKDLAKTGGHPMAPYL